MNNFQQKKIIANIKTNKDMPYQYESDVSLKTNQNIYAATLNNTFQQLVDNDLFNERHLIAYTNNKYGAKISSDIDWYSAENGTKVFDINISNLNNSQLQIYRKAEATLSGTLTELDASKQVTFFIENEYIDGIIIGTTNGLYSLKSVKDDFTELLSDISDGNKNFVDYYNDGKILLVATTNRIYKYNVLSIDEDATNGTIYKGDFSISSDTIVGDITCIDVLDENIYIGTKNGLKYCTLDNLNNIYDIQGVSSEIKDITVFDNDGYKNVIAATETDQYINESIVTFTNLIKIKFQNKTTIKDSFYFNSKKYYVSTNGIFYLDNTVANKNSYQIRPATTEKLTNITDIFQNESGIYIVSNSKLYRINDNNEKYILKLEEVTTGVSNLNKFAKFGNFSLYILKSETIDNKIQTKIIYTDQNNTSREFTITGLNSSNILKSVEISGGLCLIATNGIYIVTDNTIKETVLADFNKEKLSNYYNISAFERIGGELYGVSAKSLIKINRLDDPSIITLSGLNSNIKYVKYLNNVTSPHFGSIFVGDGTTLLFNKNISQLSDNSSTGHTTCCLTGIKDIAFSQDYVAILSADNTIRYFPIDLSIDNSNINSALKYSIAANQIDGLEEHIFAFNGTTISILADINTVKLENYDVENTTYEAISSNIKEYKLGNILYFNNFSDNLYLNNKCYAINIEGVKPDDTNNNCVEISALNNISANNAYIYILEKYYDGLTYNKYYLLFGNSQKTGVSCYEIKNNDLHINSLYKLSDLEFDPSKITTDTNDFYFYNVLTAGDKAIAPVGFLEHNYISNDVSYTTVAAINSSAKVSYTETNYEYNKILSASKYFYTPYPAGLSTAKEDVQLELQVNASNIIVNTFSYLNYVNTPVVKTLNVGVDGCVGIDYVIINDYIQPEEIKDNPGKYTYSFSNYIFLYGEGGIVRAKASVTLSDMINSATEYRTISVTDAKKIYSSNVKKFRVTDNSANNALLLSGTTLYKTSGINTAAAITTTLITSNVTDFEVIDDTLYVISNQNLLSSKLNSSSFTTITTATANTKLYRTCKNLVSAEINSSIQVFEDPHFHNINNRSVFIKNGNDITRWYDDETTYTLTSSTVTNINENDYLENITGIRYVESEISYTGNPTVDIVLTGTGKSGLYVQDSKIDISRLASDTTTSSLQLLNISNIQFASQFDSITYSLSEEETGTSAISGFYNVYLFACSNSGELYYKVLKHDQAFSQLTNSAPVLLNSVADLGAKIYGIVKQMFVQNGICYVLTKDSSSSNYYVYKITASIMYYSASKTTEVQMQSTLFETIPIKYIPGSATIDKIVLLPNDKIGYYIKISDSSAGFYTGNKLIELFNYNTLTGIQKYKIKNDVSFLIPTGSGKNISVYMPNSKYTAYKISGLIGWPTSFNIIDNDVFISYATNLSTFNINEIEYSDSQYRINNLQTVNDFLSTENVTNILFYDTFQVKEKTSSNKNFVNIQISSYSTLSTYNDKLTYLDNITGISNITFLNNTTFRANTKNSDGNYFVKDFQINKSDFGYSLTEQILSIVNQPANYMYNTNIYKVGNDTYYFTDYTYKTLNYKNISNVYYISENVLFDRTSDKNVYIYNNINSYQIFSKLIITNVDKADVNKYVDIDNVKYVIANNNKNVYRLFDLTEKILTLTEVLSSDTEIYNILIDNNETDKFTAKKVPRYMLLSANNIFYTYNFIDYLETGKTNFLLSTGISNNIYDIIAFNINEFLIATTNGLYCTKYTYTIVSDVYNTLTGNQILDDVQPNVSETLASHIADYHKDTDDKVDLIPYINKYAVNVDFSDVIISTDILLSAEFESQTPCISAYQYINDTYQRLNDITYIIKHYKDDKKEMFINIPTTNTQYIPHLQGNIGCNFANTSLYRKNTQIATIGNPALANNIIYLFVSKDYFPEYPEIDINGSSLPLDIYKDSENKCADAENYFHSYCLQTLVSEISDTAYLSSEISNEISVTTTSTLTCTSGRYAEISANKDVTFITSVDTFIISSTSAGNVPVATAYVTYASAGVAIDTKTTQIYDRFFDTNNWRIKLRCFGTDEQSLILRTSYSNC